MTPTAGFRGSMRALLSPRMPYRQVRAHLSRLVLSILAVALGVALIVAVRLMNASVLEAFEESADAIAGRAALTVSAGEGLTFSDTLVDTLAAIPGIHLAVPLVRSVAFRDDTTGEVLTVHGVDLANEAAIRVYDRAARPGATVDNPLEFLNQMDSVLIGRQFADEHGLTEGSALDVVTPNGVKRFVVRGLLEPKGLARTLHGRLIVMDLYAAERAFTADGQINQIDIVLAEGADPTQVRAAVAAALPAGLRVEEPSVRRLVIANTVAGFQALLTALSLLAVLAGFIICYSRLSSIFRVRAFQVGLLRAVGLRRWVVFLELLKESLLIGAAGSLIGIVGGIAIGRYALPFLSRSTAIALRLPVPAPSPGLEADAIALGLILGLLAAALAATAPAFRLARTEPVSALRMGGLESPSGMTPVGRRRWLVLLLITIAVLVPIQMVTQASSIGNLITGLIAVMICVFATSVIAIGAAAIRPVLQYVFGASGRLAVSSILDRPGRSALTVATFGLGIGTTLMFGMLAWSFEQTLISILARSLRADLIVSSAFVSGGYWSAPLRDELVGATAALPGVAAAAGEQSKEVAYGNDFIFLKTYDPIAFHDRRIYEWPLDGGALPGALDLVSSGQAALATAAFAYRYQTKPGDTVVVDSPSGPVPIRVAAVSQVPIENAIILSRERYRDTWNDPMVSLIHVVAAPGQDPAALGDSIRRELGTAHRLQVRSGPELIRYFADQVRQAFSLAYIAETVIFALIVIAIGDNLATGVVERTRELAMMRAVGLRRAWLFRLVMLEGATIGMLGLALAAIGGLALGRYWVQVQFPAILGWRLDMHFPWGFAAAAGALAILLSLVGSFLPSRRAARMHPAEALRYE
jgi:putative ABC transport system permease protein